MRLLKAFGQTVVLLTLISVAIWIFSILGNLLILWRDSIGDKFGYELTGTLITNAPIIIIGIALITLFFYKMPSNEHYKN